MSVLIHYDPNQAPGTERTMPNGTTIRYVKPEEYYPRLLDRVMNATVVFLHLSSPASKVPESERVSVEDAIADIYWEKYRGCLLAPAIRSIFRDMIEGRSGDLLLDELDDVFESMFAAPTIEDAKEIHATARVQMLDRGAEGMLTESQAAFGEFMVDYLLLQRGIAEDVRRAERERHTNAMRGSVLARYDQKGEMEFERMLMHIMRSEHIYQMIPAGRWRQFESFARRRRPFHKMGLLPKPLVGDGTEEDDDSDE